MRQAGAIFSAPTYAFVLAMFALIAVGLVDASGRGFAPTPVVGLDPIEGITVLLVLRAFSSGATAMTGIEAISNAVPAFQPPASRNARTVLALMVGLLVAMFAGLVVLMHLDGIVPRSGQTALSQLAHRSFGSGPLYVYVQVATALVLLLAANTSFNGFPRLLSIMARNGHAPRLFLRLGDRLAFSNGTIALAAAAAVLFVVFAGRTEALIPLYAVGVFVAFTFSQVGMVVHWWRRRDAHWRKSMLLNGVGAALSAIVFVIAAVTKFSHGAWVALLLIALLALFAWRIRRHYDSVHRALALYPLDASAPNHPIVPTRLQRSARQQPLPSCLEPRMTRVPTSSSISRSCRSSASTWPACAPWPTPPPSASPCWPCTSAPATTRQRASRATGPRGAITCHSRWSTPPTGRSSRRWPATSTRCAPSDPTSRSPSSCPRSSSSTAGSNSCTTAPRAGCDAPCDANPEWSSPPSRFTWRPDRGRSGASPVGREPSAGQRVQEQVEIDDPCVGMPARHQPADGLVVQRSVDREQPPELVVRADVVSGKDVQTPETAEEDLLGSRTYRADLRYDIRGDVGVTSCPDRLQRRRGRSRSC